MRVVVSFDLLARTGNPRKRRGTSQISPAIKFTAQSEPTPLFLKWGEQVFSRSSLSGIVKIVIKGATLQKKHRWYAVVTLGNQSFRTSTASSSKTPVWNSEKKVALEENGARVCRVSIIESQKLSKNKLEGYAEFDLSSIFKEGNQHADDEIPLYNPSTKTQSVGTLRLSYIAEPAHATIQQFSKRLLTLGDRDQNGILSLAEFRELMHAFGNPNKDKEMEELFQTADKNGDGIVTTDELAELVAVDAEKHPLLQRCPVCGEDISDKDALNAVVHMSLCFNEGSTNTIMTGGFLTEAQATHGWMFRMSEWAHWSSYDVGLHQGANASHILVFDRTQKRLREELIDNKIVLAMRAIYQSKLGLVLLDAGTRRYLASMSEKQGLLMDKPESAAAIPKFLKAFEGEINVDEMKLPLSEFKTFNEFFTRELKPSVRPISSPENDNVAVCAADCRLMAFNDLDAATRFWVKGRKFSLAGLLADKHLGKEFEGGSMAIFRLAPQDYHRFHFPVTCTVGSITPVKGHLFTVNPIAVNSKYCDVFTENKRSVAILKTKEFGDVAFVAIGATMVGTITFLKSVGEQAQKGDQFGHFKFGGSTCIVVFKKDAISLDEDLIANSERSLETLVQLGQTLGVAKGVPVMTRRPSIYDSVVGVEGLPSSRPHFVTEETAVPGVQHVDLPASPQNEAPSTSGEPPNTPSMRTPPAMPRERRDDGSLTPHDQVYASLTSEERQLLGDHAARLQAVWRGRTARTSLKMPGNTPPSGNTPQTSPKVDDSKGHPQKASGTSRQQT
ncbi:phosphatidylserine decarboxylase [Klebsormidium nitens]|uniref:Phosphatidylserine decarboxylase proenzyme 2 n=1 Tax=Klebsormidium nitens TaxID=105231 RepID=A0A1Y1I670_KLENI|nr:phosphatidylserine decarboxylase [Klebsormidium nitens]|eukprot:GAQ86455.1 phosphatidylserine decarboxylase [Klebsormidium nitens]